ncbi:hypothetical protein PEC331060_25260 [Pectobacterium carotovorum subsp. carotovorum]|nr:hypothetical protein PEC331060_25260 [Pectobacterium carotovorum subsp. carotovorum]
MPCWLPRARSVVTRSTFQQHGTNVIHLRRYAHALNTASLNETYLSTVQTLWIFCCLAHHLNALPSFFPMLAAVSPLTCVTLRIYPSYFKLHVRWLRSVTRITYLSKLIGIPSLAACLKLELFRVSYRAEL